MCHAQRQGEIESGVTNVAGRIDFHGFKSKEERDTRLETEFISQCGSRALKESKPSRTNMTKMKLEGQLDLVEYSQIIVPESVHMGYPAGGHTDIVKARNTAKGHLMAWHDKQSTREHLKDLMTGSHLERKKYVTVMS